MSSGGLSVYFPSQSAHFWRRQFTRQGSSGVVEFLSSDFAAQHLANLSACYIQGRVLRAFATLLELFRVQAIFETSSKEIEVFSA